MHIFSKGQKDLENLVEKLNQSLLVHVFWIFERVKKVPDAPGLIKLVVM